MIKKLNFFVRFKKALTKFEDYKIFAAEKKRTALGYFTKLILIIVAIFSIILTIFFSNTLNNITELIKELPDFSFNQNKIVLSEEVKPFSKPELFDGIIIIDANSIDITEKNMEEIKKYGNGVIFLQDKIKIKFGDITNIFEMKYSELKLTENFNKNDVITFLSSDINTTTLSVVIFIIIYIYVFIFYFSSILIDVFILSFIGFITSKIYNVKIKYTEIFKMSIYAMTLSILLTLIYFIVRNIFGFEIKYFQIMYNSVSFIYLITAILMIKTDLLKQKMEVIGVIQNKQEEPKQEETEAKDKNDKENNDDNNSESDSKEKKKLNPETEG